MNFAALREVQFLAGRQGLPSDAQFIWRLGVELVTRSRRIAALGPCLLVTGRAPSGWNWREALSLSRRIGGWCAAQGFAVLTLGESGLSEALATSCERSGGSALRCVLDPVRTPGHISFSSELARRIVASRLARATLALAPTGETPGMLLFLHALARFERIPPRPELLLGPAQWDISEDAACTTQLIESLEDLSRSLALE